MKGLRDRTCRDNEHGYNLLRANTALRCSLANGGVYIFEGLHKKCKQIISNRYDLNFNCVRNSFIRYFLFYF